MKRSINLLPASFQRQLLVRRRAVQWGAVIGVVLALGAAAHWYDLREQQALSQRLQLLTREHRPTQRMLQQLIDMRGELEQLQQHERIARELEHQRPALALLGILSGIGERTGGRLRITKLELTDLQHPQAEGQGALASRGSLTLTGTSLDNPAVADLIEGLDDSNFFSYVELQRLTEISGENSALREYQVRCEL